MIRRTRNPLRRLLTALIAVPLAATGLMVAAAAPANAATIRAFTPIFTANTTGDVVLTGNTLLACPARSLSITLIPQIPCVTGQGAGSFGANNYFSMVNVDIDSDSTTF